MFKRLGYVMLMTFSSAAEAQQSVDACKDILIYASRDLSSQISYNDRRKSLYKEVCESGASSAGLEYEDASSSLGLSYGSKSDYCKTEKEITSNISYSNTNSSIVVQASLQAYVDCRKLANDGVVTDIALPTSLNPTSFIIGVRQVGPKAVTVKSVTFDPAVASCSWIAADGKKKSISEQTSLVLKKLSDGDRWALNCSRTPVVDPTGSKTYPEVQLQVDTNFGPASYILAESGSASSVWKTELQAQLTNKLKALDNRVSSIKLEFPFAEEIDIAQSNTWRDCSPEASAYGFKTPGVNDRLDVFRCRYTRIQIPSAVIP